MNIRMLPSTTGNNSHTVNKRTITAAVGSFQDVPDFDAAPLNANGWTAIGNSVGATTARPTGAVVFRGWLHIDTTLGFIIVWDGSSWRNPANAAAV